MAILQALLAFVGRSASKILNAVFGWAVRALFGNTSGAQQVLLTAVVALAALWPILLVGIVVPRAAAFVLAFVPVPEGVSEAVVRLVWIALAVLVPAIVGIALAAKRPDDAPAESMWLRMARGYPTTLALAVAFWISFVTVPLVRLKSLLRGHTAVHVPLVTDAAGYHDAAARIRGVLDAHRFALAPNEPPAWVTAPMTVLRALGGRAFRDYVPDRLEHFAGPGLDVTLHPSSLLLRGPEAKIAYAHGLVVEALTPADALQTTVPEAQDIERQIRRVWQVLAERPRDHARSPWLRSRLDDIVGDIARLETSYDDWQIVYRQALQLARAIDGEPQLLARNDEGGSLMAQADHVTEPYTNDWQRRSTRDLMREVASKTTLLVRKELELARAEIRHDLAAERTVLKSFAVAAVTGMATLNLLLVAAVFALTPWLVGWLAALAIAGVTLLVTLVAAGIGWKKHVRQPLDRTRKTLKEDVQWVKEELA